MRTRCSVCQKPLKPVVALDIDGTLGDYHGHLIEFAEGWLGRPVAPHAEYSGVVKLREHIGVDQATHREIKLAYRQGGMKRTMPVFQWADVLTDQLHNAGAEIWICTTRPWLRLDNIDPDTREWCRRNGIQYDYMIYGDDKYDQLAELVHPERIVGAFDDLPEQLERAEVLKLGPVLRVNHHNAYAWGPAAEAMGAAVSYPTVSVYDAIDLLVTRVRSWYNANES